jgi:hypothetical protein
MSHRVSSILGLGLLLTAAAVAPRADAQSPSVTGTWANDHGSVLVIRSVGPDGSVSGTYANNAAGYKCAGIAFPLVGWMDGPRISYTVRWKTPRSIARRSRHGQATSTRAGSASNGS